jgi:glycosyltransferase involved in cell wall biosynthesis
MKKIVIDARESGTSTGRYVDKLIEYLYKIEPDYNFIILTKDTRVDFMKEIAPKYQVIATPYKEFSFGEQIGLQEQIGSLQADLVHFGMVQQPIFYSGKVVTTMHDLTTTRFKNPSKNWLVYVIKQKIYIRVNKIVAHKSNAIITPTEFVREDVARFAKINSRKITVTYESADKIKDQAEAYDGLEDKQFLLYVGRPMPHKNLDRLVEAYEKLKKTNKNLHLVFAGKKDSLYKQLEKNVEERGLENVTFTDFVSEGQLRWLYENCRAYVFPSLSEGFGLPGLEAMAQGAPVISSNATCLPEVYGDAAEYFNPNDTEDMVRAINSVVTSKKKRDKLTELGFKKIGEYSWRRMADQTLKVYKEVLEDKYPSL